MFTTLVEHGYAVSYNPQEDKLVFTTCSFKSCPDTDSLSYAKTFMETLRERKKLFTDLKPEE